MDTEVDSTTEVDQGTAVPWSSNDVPVFIPSGHCAPNWSDGTGMLLNQLDGTNMFLGGERQSEWCLGTNSQPEIQSLVGHYDSYPTNSDYYSAEADLLACPIGSVQASMQQTWPHSYATPQDYFPDSSFDIGIIKEPSTNYTQTLTLDDLPLHDSLMETGCTYPEVPNDPYTWYQGPVYDPWPDEAHMQLDNSHLIESNEIPLDHGQHLVSINAGSPYYPTNSAYSTDSAILMVSSHHGISDTAEASSSNMDQVFQYSMANDQASESQDTGSATAPFNGPGRNFTRLREPTSADWEMLRPIIWAYKEGGNTYREITKMLNGPKHGFKITEKMLKDRIGAWGLHTYMREDEKAAIMDQLRIRDAQQKRSSILVRGKPVQRRSLFRRTGKRKFDQPRLELALKRPLPPSVTIRTPPPSPLADSPMMAISEELAWHVKSYIRRGFELGNWKSVSRSILIASLTPEIRMNMRLLGKSFETLIRLYERPSSFAEKLVTTITEEIDNFAFFQNLNLIIVLLSLTGERKDPVEQIRFLPLMRRLATKAAAMLSTSHPFYRICKSVESVLTHAYPESSWASNAFRIGWQCMVDACQNALGRFHVKAATIELLFIYRILIRCNWTQATSKLRDLLDHFKNT